MVFVLQRLLALPRSRYLQVVLYKTYADLVSETQRFYIGYLWWIIEPIIDMCVYYLLFGILFKNRTPDFVPFLFVGILTWRWFQSSLMIAASSILSSKGLMNQVYLPKIIFPTVALLTNTFKFIVAFSLLLGFCQIYGLPIGVTYTALPLLLLVEFLFIVGTSYIIAGLVPFFPDLRVIVQHSLQVIFYLSGIFFAISSLPERFQPYLRLNPMASLIEGFRQILLHGLWPDFSALAIIGIFSLVLIFSGFFLLRRFDSIYPKVTR